MAETGQCENGSEGNSKAGNHQNTQTNNNKPTAHSSSQPSHSEKIEDSSNQGVESSIASPPSSPPSKSSQGEERRSNSSEPNSPQPDDSFSDRGEQQLEDDRGVFLPPGGGMMLLDHPQGFLPSGGMMPPMVPIQSKGLSSDGQPNSPPPPHGEELKKLLLQQLEYYFSKDNLSSDKYLLSQMDGDHYVPISVIANFNQVKRLSTDISLIMEAIRESSQLQLDDGDEKVRAIPEKRCVLILREIPKNTPKEDITALFASPKCPAYVTCEFADNDCWYVTFDSEEGTQKAFTYLREEVREFLGQPIRARIKGTTVQRPSGMPKKRFTYPMQYNGAPPQQMPFYQQPNMVAAWPPYYDPNYTPYMNGFPSQQGFNGPPNRFNNPGPHQMSGGRPPGGNGHLPPHQGHSPSAPNSIENASMVGGGRGPRGDHYAPPGGRFRRENEDQQRIPRLRNRHRATDQPPLPSQPLPPPSSSSSSSSSQTQSQQPTQDKSQLPPRQRTRAQQKLDLAPANFPPLPTSSDNGTTAPAPAPPPQNHVEEGVSNLADIVKGKRLKDGGGVNATGANCLPEKQSKGNSQVVAKVQPSSQASQPPRPPRSDTRIPTRENKSSNGNKGSTRPNDRDKQNNSRNSQVPRPEGKPTLPTRGRHKDRRPGLGPRPQQPRTSPKPPKKQTPPQAPPPPPTPTTLSPTSSDNKNPAKQENGVIKSERPSYARVAKAQPPSPPPPPPPRTLPSSATPNSPHPPPLPSNQSKQSTPTSPQAKTGSSNSSNDTAVPSVVGNSQPSTASEGGTAQNSS